MASIIRINTLTNGGGAPSMAELGLFTSLDGTNIAGTGTATASSTFSSQVPANAINGDGTNSIWSSAGGPPQWIQISFAVDIAYIAKVTIQARTGEPFQTAYTFEVLRSQDGGSNFELLFTGSELSGWSGGQIKTFLNPNPFYNAINRGIGKGIIRRT